MSVVLALAFAVCAPVPAQAPDVPGARVVTLSGTLTMQRPGQTPQPLALNAIVQTGDELVTGPESGAVIRTPDGATIRIFPGSRFVLTAPSSGVSEFLHLLFGTVKVHIEKLSGRPNPHRMTTPTAVIAVRGTTFTVLVEDAGATLVAVDEGEVAVSNVALPSQVVILGRGRRTLVLPGQAPQRAQRFRGQSEQAGMAPWRGNSGNQPQTGAPGMSGAAQRGGMAAPGAMRGRGRGR